MRRRARITRGISVGHSNKSSALLQEETSVKLGHRFSHRSLGKDVAISAEGSSGRARLQVNFEGAGGKVSGGVVCESNAAVA